MLSVFLSYRLTGFDRAKIASAIEAKGMSVDEDTASELTEIVREEDEAVKKGYPEDSFQMLFWEQLRKASQRFNKGMRWHPMLYQVVYLPKTPVELSI